MNIYYEGKRGATSKKGFDKPIFITFCALSAAKGMVINMKRKLICILTLSMLLILSVSGCSPKGQNPQELLDQYFTSAQHQDYDTTYTCYDSEYQKKVTKEEYVKHRKEASTVQSYKILQLDTQKDTGKASVEITYAPSEKFKRTEPVTIKVQEELIKEKNGWKIKV